MPAQNRPLGLPPLSREHLHSLEKLFAGSIWRMYCNLVQKAYFSLQWQDLLGSSNDEDCLRAFSLHCRSGKSFVITMIMIGPETCEDHDNEVLSGCLEITNNL